jgi:hypothetical protein
MTQRRSLIEGLKEPPPAVDPDKEKAYPFTGCRGWRNPAGPVTTVA